MHLWAATHKKNQISLVMYETRGTRHTGCTAADRAGDWMITHTCTSRGSCFVLASPARALATATSVTGRRSRWYGCSIDLARRVHTDTCSGERGSHCSPAASRSTICTDSPGGGTPRVAAATTFRWASTMRAIDCNSRNPCHCRCTLSARLSSSAFPISRPYSS